MITFTVRELAERKGVRSGYELMQLTKLPSSTAYRIWNLDEQEFVSKTTIERICAAFDCTPCDFIKFVPEGGGAAKKKPKAAKK